MRDAMCIQGYGVRLEAIWPCIDAGKLGAAIEETLGCSIHTARKANESAMAQINRIDDDLAGQSPGFSLSDVFDHLDASRLTELVDDNRAEWFFYIPASMPWAYGDGIPQTPEDADTLLTQVLHLLLKAGVTDEEVRAHFDDLYVLS